ncbi:hypothetical protein HDV00_007529 [Rhizophlyctis rosea]|nr:hypothetical protein HDV00_007529 [Rhizophlyctis rosea]
MLAPLLLSADQAASAEQSITSDTSADRDCAVLQDGSAVLAARTVEPDVGAILVAAGPPPAHKQVSASQVANAERSMAFDTNAQPDCAAAHHGPTTTGYPTYQTSFPNVPYTSGGVTTKPQTDSERNECLEVHNAARRNVDSYTKPASLTYDTKLEAAACAWARYLANSNKLIHSGGKVGSGQGENLYRVSSSSARHGVGADIGSCKAAAQSWAYEAKYYYSGLKIGQYPGTEAYGHYTQMVWPSTKRVGCCGWQSPDRTAETWVCEYSPAGNYVGQAAF